MPTTTDTSDGDGESIEPGTTVHAREDDNPDDSVAIDVLASITESARSAPRVRTPRTIPRNPVVRVVYASDVDEVLPLWRGTDSGNSAEAANHHKDISVDHFPASRRCPVSD